MNDIEKAIETLQNYSPCSQENLYQAHQVAITALEKQIPKKVKQYNDKSIFIYEGVFYCPSCQENVSMDDVYCCQCGQSLDWEVENE